MVIRIKDIPTNVSPNPNLWVPTDLSSTGKVSVQTLVDTGAPIASQAEAEAGVQATKRMTPLTTAQAIAIQAATAAEGELANTAVQPGDLAVVAFTGDYNDLSDLPTLSADAIFADRATAIAATIGPLNKRLRTQFYDTSATKRKGGAQYRESTESEVAYYPTRGWFTSNGGTRYWLLDESMPSAFQFGAEGDGVSDDSEALQHLLSFWAPVDQVGLPLTPWDRPLAMAGGGPVLIEKGVFRHTQTLYHGAFVRVFGQGQAMFPQAPLDGSEFGQFDFPNATILRPDFALADRTFGVGLHSTPYVLKDVAGGSDAILLQTPLTKFRSLSADSIAGPDIDNGYINYTEGANIEGLSIWPVNEIYAGIRWTAATKSTIRDVSIRGTKRGIHLESCWESSIINAGIFDVKDYAIYGGGNLHAFVIQSLWFVGANRVLNGDKPVGIYANFFDGLVIQGCAIDDSWDAIVLQNGVGATITGCHFERFKDVWLTANGAYGVTGGGNHIIQNVIDARTYENSILFDGNDCDVDIDVTASDSAIAGNYPGKTMVQGTNPNTGDPTFLTFATTSHVGLTFRNMPPRATDPVRVNRQSGGIRFISNDGICEVGGSSNGNVVLDTDKITGDAGVKRSRDKFINASRRFYIEEDAEGMRVYKDGTNELLLGYNFTNRATLVSGGYYIIPTFGNPNSSFDAPLGSLALDSSNGRPWCKTTALGTLTGWVQL